MQGPAGAQPPIGGGGVQGPGANRGEPAKDETKPSPRAQEPEDQSGDTVAPQGQAQTDMVLRSVRDLLEKDAVTPDLEKETGMTREQMEQFVKKYEKVKSGPAGPGREIQVKPGERGEDAKPSANLPGINRQDRYSSKNIKDKGAMPRDEVRNNLEVIRFAPPQEFRSKVEGYKSTLARSRPGSAPRPAPARAGGGQ